MGDEMDPCECIWNHELAMRRLINLLRQSQTYCTDSECLEELPGLPQPNQGADNWVIMFLMIAFGVVMYVMRPRQRQIQDAKPARNSQDHDGAPPTPPRI